MKEPKKTYVGAAVFFERVADDGWPEDAGLSPQRLSGFALGPLNTEERVKGAKRLSPSQFIKSLLRSANCTWLSSF